MNDISPLIDGPPALDVAGFAATITFRRPREHNRIDPDDIGVVRGYLDDVAARPEVRAVVLTGTGGTTFSSGFTLGAIVGRLDRSFEDLLDAIERYPLPTICAINGSVYGGATDLALCCDFRIGVQGSRMFMPAARFGLHYHPGGLRRFVTQIGPAETKRLFLTAQTIEAQTMLRIGFLTDLVVREALGSRVNDYIAALGKCEPGVVRSMKAQINAIAAGDNAAGVDRRHYEDSLRSEELRKRVGAVVRRG
jgi:enoyl-CoA hydratase/carnithine racemase